MQIVISEFREGARQARGLTVIIDVFRAFSVACYAVDSGASRIIATGDPDEAFRVKERYPNSLLVGERNETKIAGFDFCNSPTEIIKCDLSGKTLIHTTTAGTVGLVSAVNADLIITGSLVNASAVARFIAERKPGHVSLVAMGFRATISAEEDLLCAEYIKSKLEGREGNFDDRIAGLRHTAGQRFFNPENIDFSPPTDFFLCTMTDRFDFVLKAERRNDGNIDLRRTDF
ncbi:MAG: 2-phosphosulfolactate phosphatase [Deltaproteobacteria bacterium]|nr:2-phosphosulfolactate phosphatase [Deltaproteobacteria bacterium]